MIPLTIKYNQKKYFGTIPENWDELKIKHFMALEGDKSELEILSIISGIDLEVVSNTPINLDPYMIKLGELFNELPPDFTKEPKNSLEVLGKRINPPQELRLTSYGQRSMVKSLLLREVPIEAIVSEVLAIYIQPMIDGKIDINRFPVVQKAIEELSMSSSAPWAVFFFKRLRKLRLDSTVISILSQ